MRFRKIFFVTKLILLPFILFAVRYGTVIEPAHLLILKSVLEKNKELPEIKYLQKACDIYDKVETGNYEDIHLLLSEIRKLQPFKLTSQEIDPCIIKETIQKLIVDKEQLKKYNNILKINTKKILGCHPIRTNLHKFFGSNQNCGIYDDAIKMLNASCIHLYSGKIDEVDPTHNKISVLKTALIYLYLTLNNVKTFNNKREILNQLHVVYPAQIPKLPYMPEADAIVKNIALYDEHEKYGPCLRLPNAGYVFCGHILEDKCYGTDCSAFVTYATEASRVILTSEMEKIWKAKIDRLKPIVSNIEDPKQLAIYNEYEAIDFTKNTDQLKVADLVVWRKTTGGHVAFFLEWLDKNKGEFLGFDLNRTDDKTFEGFGIKPFNINKPGFISFGLRRVEPVMQPIPPLLTDKKPIEFTSNKIPSSQETKIQARQKKAQTIEI